MGYDGMWGINSVSSNDMWYVVYKVMYVVKLCVVLSYVVVCIHSYTCLDHGLRLMHPFMPFVSEELYQRLPGRHVLDSVAVVAYPSAQQHWIDNELEERFRVFQEVVHAIRSSRASIITISLLYMDTLTT